MKLSFNEMTDEETRWPEDQNVVLTFGLWDDDSWAVEVLNQSLTFDYDMIRKRVRQDLTIRGAIIGYNDLRVSKNCPDCYDFPLFLKRNIHLNISIKFYHFRITFNYF